MSRWEERIASPAVESLEQLQAVIDRLAEGLDEGELPELSRLRRALAVARSHVDNADAELVSHHVLDQLNVKLSETLAVAQDQLTRRDAGETPNLVTVNEAADGLLYAISGLPPLPAGREAGLIRRTTEDLQKDAIDILSALREQAAAVNALLDQVRDETNTAVEARDASLQAMENRVNELSSGVEQQVARLETALQEQGGRFDEAQESRRAEFSQLLKDQENAASSALAEITDQAKLGAEEFTKAAEQRIANLDASQAKAEETLGAIARSGMAVGYQEYADAETKTADKYRRFTIWVAVAVVGVLVWAVLHAATGGQSTQEVLAKSGISVALFGLAGYTARQSQHHRMRAQGARSIQLALASLGPYLAELDQERRERVIEAFTYVFFAPRESGKATEPGPGQAAAVLEFLKRAEQPPP